jgi:hypothetical protein
MIQEKEYLVICDESERKGKYFSNFYGGVRVGMSELAGVNARLTAKKAALGLNSEVKWCKTDTMSVDRYKELIELFFDEIEAGRVIVRIMFTQNARAARGLTQQHYEAEYYILYYHFIKHVFGFRHMPPHARSPRLRVYLDEIGDTKEQIAKFRGFIAGLSQDSMIRRHGLILNESDITEVRSHDHVLLQCLDVVLGSIPFRLNDKHLEKLPGKRVRGKRTIAKEKLYKFINQQICRVAGEHFNVGCSTSVNPYPEGLWSMKYRHWLFKSTDTEFDSGKTKPK